MTKYVIMNRKTGRFYTSSKSKKVDPFDIHYAKIFPTVQSAKSAMQWFDTFYLNLEAGEWENEYDTKGWQPRIFEVETKVVLGNQINFQ